MQKHWVKLGKLEGAPEGRYEMDGVLFATNPDTKESWMYVNNNNQETENGIRTL